MREQVPGPLPPGRTRDQLVDAVRADLEDVPEAAVVVVATSGGPDSAALAFLTAEARPDLRPTLAHVRHGLRDDAADVAAVRQHAAWLGAPLEVVEVEVAADGRGVEAAARDARYAALRTVAARLDAAGILVGHSADDQAETVLLRAARGTGVSGVAAMRRRTGDLWRPLLRVRRSDLRRFVSLEGIRVAADPTNEDRQVRRVVVRTDVLPHLEAVAPDPVGALGRLAALAADDDAALEAIARDVWTRRAVRCGEVVAVRDHDLDPSPPAVRRRVWRQVLAEVAPGPPPPAAVIEGVLALPAGRRLEVGDVEVTAGGGWRTAAPATTPRRPPAPVAVPGTTAWEPAGAVLHAVTPDGAAGDDVPSGQIAFTLSGAWTPPEPVGRTLVPPGGDGARCVLALPAEVGPLHLRHREPGDRIRTVGGTRRVADALVDARIPRPVRDRWPLLVAGDAVVWVPGVDVDAEVLAAGRAAPGAQLHLRAAPTAPAGRAAVAGRDPRR